MKIKKIIALLVTILLISSNFTSNHVYAEGHKHNESGTEIDFGDAIDLNDYLGNAENYTVIQTGKDYMPTANIVDLPSGNYVVSEEDTSYPVFIAVQSGAVVNICLNGYELSTYGTYGNYTNGSMDCAIAGELNIYDCSEEGNHGKFCYDEPAYKQYEAFLLVGITSGTEYKSGTLNIYGKIYDEENRTCVEANDSTVSTICVQENSKLNIYNCEVGNDYYGETIDCSAGSEVLIDNSIIKATQGRAYTNWAYSTNTKASKLVIKNNSKLYTEENDETICFGEGELTIEDSTIENNFGYCIEAFAAASTSAPAPVVNLKNATFIGNSESIAEYYGDDVFALIHIYDNSKLNLAGNNVFTKDVGTDILYKYSAGSEEEEPSKIISITSELKNTSPIGIYVETFDDDPSLNEVKLIEGFDTYMSGKNYLEYFAAYKNNSEVYVSKREDDNIYQNRLYYTTQPTSQTKKAVANTDGRSATYQWYKQSTTKIDNTLVDDEFEWKSGTYNDQTGLWEPTYGGWGCYYLAQVIKDGDKYYNVEIVVPAGTYYTYVDEPVGNPSSLPAVKGWVAPPLVTADEAFTCKIQAKVDGSWVDVTDENNISEDSYGTYSEGVFTSEQDEWQGYQAVNVEVDNATQYKVTFENDLVAFSGVASELEESEFSSLLKFNYQINAYEKEIVTGQTTDTLTTSTNGTYVLETTIGEAKVYSNAITVEGSSSTEDKATLSNVSASAITYGQALSNSTITGTAKFNNNDVTGTWSWKEASTKPAVSNSDSTEYTVVFTPDAQTYPNLKASEINIKIKVNKAKVDLPSAASNLIYNGQEQTGVELPDGAKYTIEGNTGTNASDSYSATVKLTDKDNYEWNLTTPTSDDQTINFSIAKKTITVTADNKESYVGSDLEDLTYTNDSLCEGDSFTGKLTTTANKDSVGTADITQGDLSAGNNYSITYVKATYTVKALESQNLSFDDETITKTYGDSKFSQTVNGDETTVTYTSSDTSVATVDSSTGEVTILKAGTTTITATAEKTAIYAEASATYTLTVNKAKVELPSAKTGLTYNGKQQTGVELPDGAKYTIEGNTGTNASDSYSATVKLTDKDNYEWNLTTPTSDDQTINFSIAKKTITVTANDKTMNLGEALPKFGAVVEGLIGQDEITYSFNSLNPTTQGVYSIVPTGEAEQGNYSVTYVQGKLIVKDNNGNTKVNPDNIVEVLEEYQNKQEYEDKSLDVELRISDNVSQADKDLIKAAVVSGKKIVYADANIFLIIKDSEGTNEKNIGDENDTLISITYKFNFKNRKEIQVLRVHNELVDELTETANGDGEFVKYNKEEGTITVTAKKYSTYGFAYKTISSGTYQTVKTGIEETNNVSLKLVSLLSLVTIAGVVTLKKKRH